MLIVEAGALADLQRAIIDAAQCLSDTAGERAILSTVGAKQIKQAALIALQITSGDVIWPGDEKLRIRERSPTYGPFEIERR